MNKKHKKWEERKEENNINCNNCSINLFTKYKFTGVTYVHG